MRATRLRVAFDGEHRQLALTRHYRLLAGHSVRAIADPIRAALGLEVDLYEQTGAADAGSVDQRPARRS